MEEKILKEYKRWLDCAKKDPDLIRELSEMNENQIEDAFYQNLNFGTGGLRGIIGAGTNRMNIYMVARATKGLCLYLKEQGKSTSVVIGYDSRIKSLRFARTAAAVFHVNGIKVYLWNRLLPVSTVSYAVRYLHAGAGVMITASHNASKYNGYKVYDSNGCQISPETADKIQSYIQTIDYFKTDIPEFTDEMVSFIPDEILDSFLNEVKKQSVTGGDIDRNLSVVYTPLNGTGLEPVTRILKEKGFSNVFVVPEQKDPDGSFPTCPYPNPEDPEAMNLGIQYCRKKNADILIATDPDCDRCAIAVRDHNQEYKLLTGNETGLLLLDYICSQRVKNHRMPDQPVVMKTIVTSDMGEQIAEHYGADTVNVLTGFKNIGEQIGVLEKKGRVSDYIFGFEESCGYLIGPYVRDKDGVGAAFMIAEMTAYYKAKGMSLIDHLNELYKIYGYRLNTLHSYTFEGKSGSDQMKEIMQRFHHEQIDFIPEKVMRVIDYSKGRDGLPPSDVLKYVLEGNSSVVIRQSGTEPKLKVYISVSAQSMAEAKQTEHLITEQIQRFIE